jgi:signal transduction histidine kinase
MNRATSTLPIAGIAALVIVVLGWLLLVHAGKRDGQMPLSDPSLGTVEYFIDNGGRQKPSDIKDLAPSQWQPWSGEGFISPDRGEVLWMRITLRNAGETPLHGVLENDDFFADRLEAWMSDGRHLLTGEGVPAREKALPGRELAIPVTVPARGEEVVLLRNANYFDSYARMVWWPEETAFHLSRLHSGLAEGVYLGGLLALLCYNALLWLRLRQADIGYYVLYLGSVAAFMFLARSMAPAIGWPLESPWLETLLMAAMALSAFFLTRFAQVFLELKTFLPRAEKAAGIWSVLLLVLFLGTLTTPWWTWWNWLRITVLAAGFTNVGLLILALVAWRAQVRQARFFVLSFGCLFTGILPMLIVWICASDFRDVGMRGLMIGSALEMLMLSLAVADRFAQAQRKLVEETEQRRLIEETYADELQIEVTERTRELSAANTDKDRMLAVIGHDLRSPLTGLMHAADEMPGEFAHEVTRTSRELLLMIEDLVLWARLRAGTQVIQSHSVSALLVPALTMHHAIAEQSKVEIVADVPEGLRVEIDLVLAQTLIRNLLANALKFARTRVVLRARPREDGIYFSVENDGPALSPEVAARLANGENEPITATGGMGLRLCREICQTLGTRLEARSPEGGGTEFGFLLRTNHTPAEVTP